jgi:hypothetical protein
MTGWQDDRMTGWQDDRQEYDKQRTLDKYMIYMIDFATENHIFFSKVAIYLPLGLNERTALKRKHPVGAWPGPLTSSV